MYVSSFNDLPLERHAFGQLADGLDVDAWVLRGTGGLELEVLTYGGIVRRLLVPDRSGEQVDVVLGFDRLEDYLSPHPCFGVTAGRVAGRISGAAFELDGRHYALPANDGPNHLHGGPEGLDKRLWTAEPVERADGAPSVRLCYRSPEGEQGYPGNLDIAVTYTVTADNVFLYETEVRSDRPTPASLTHHSYFNLAGERSGNILDHRLEVASESAFLCDERMTLQGRLEPVEGKANDFREAKPIRSVVDRIWQRHGDLYWLGAPGEWRRAAQVHEPASGRRMSVQTNHPCLQTYFGASLDGSLTGKSGPPYNAFAGLCLECEGYPDALNAQGFGDILVRPEKPQLHRTAYAFDTLA